jgi:hypothetical protein
MLETAEPLNFCAFRVESMFNDRVLTTGTAFLFGGRMNDVPTMWLVTNWHLLSGRDVNPPHGALDELGDFPNRIRIRLPRRALQPHPDGMAVVVDDLALGLYNEFDNALWYRHPLKHKVDVGVINLGQTFPDHMVSAVNEVANTNDMSINVGDEVFILGYPLGFTYFVNTPIWKRGSIASEPHLGETGGRENMFVVDATTRDGMSGAPVILRAKTNYLSDDKNIRQCTIANRFIGIYASRPRFTDAEGRVEFAELGYVYKSGVIDQIINSGLRAPDYGQVDQ